MERADPLQSHRPHNRLARRHHRHGHDRRRSSASRSGIWCSRSRCWSRARPTPPASTSPPGSTAGSASARSSAAKNVAAGQLLVAIDNPELFTKLNEAEAGEAVAQAELARIDVGTRAEVVAERKAARGSRRGQPDARAADLRPRPSRSRRRDFASSQKLDEATARSTSRSAACDRPSSPTTRRSPALPPRSTASPRPTSPRRRPRSTRSRPQVDELTGQGADRRRRSIRSAPSSANIVSPGVPLLSLVDLGDVWLRFDLREDLVKGLKVGDRFDVRIPALGDRPIEAEVQHDRDARRICRMAGDARDRRLRPENLRGARLSRSRPFPGCGPG